MSENMLKGVLTNGDYDKWSATFHKGCVEIWCETEEEGTHSIMLDEGSMLVLRDMLNEMLWKGGAE